MRTLATITKLLKTKQKAVDATKKAADTSRKLCKVLEIKCEDLDEELQDLEDEECHIIEHEKVAKIITPATKWYKVTTVDGSAPFKPTSFKYSLPKGDKPGKTHVTRGKLVLCKVGFHVTTAKNIKQWLAPGRRIFEVKVSGKVIHSSDKSAFSKMQLTREVIVDSPEWKKLLKVKK